MNAGRLSKRIQIQAKVVTKDEQGSQIPNWTTIATVWAAIEPLSAREYWMAQQMQSEVSVKIIIRYRQGITPDMRVLWQNHIYEVQTIINTGEKNRELVLMCKEVV